MTDNVSGGYDMDVFHPEYEDPQVLIALGERLIAHIYLNGYCYALVAAIAVLFALR